VTLRVRAPGALVAPWVRLGNWLVAGTGDSLVVAIEPDSLRLVWSARLDGPLLSSPAVVGDTLYCVTQFGSLYRIVSGDEPQVTRLGTDRWAATGTPAVFGGWILVGASDGALRAFRQDDGAEGWRMMLGRPLALAPLVLGDREFLALGGRGDLHRMRL
jgi:outer membrane protein assembly factor BamB